MTDDDKKTILARRARFVAAALTSAGLGALAVQGCGGDTSSPGTDAAADGAVDAQPDGPSVCLSQPFDGGHDAPQPCLSPPPPDAADDADDAEPQPCLAPPPAEAGDDAVPQPCLSQPPPDAG